MIPLIDAILHINEYLALLVHDYGVWVYAIMFLIILLETGVVILPFLPGDSLLFVAGALMAVGVFNPVALLLTLSVAAILGDSLNYFIGKRIGRRAFTGKVRFLQKKHLAAAEHFYEKHGSATIVAARFLPFIRTFAPFVAGIGKMKYNRFLSYNVVGGFAWVATFLGIGYFFGNIPIIKDNFGLVFLGIVFATIAIAVIGGLRSVMQERKSTSKR